LLRVGFTPDAIINAVEAGGSALDRLQKYNPDEPRVPAGSGRTSGEWTSSDGGPSDSPQSFVSPRPEVNPDTVTQVADQKYETPESCGVAYLHCVDAAYQASRGDASNDNGPRNLDTSNCRGAFVACTMMSIGMQIQPLPIGGGVVFPHKGVVLIDKGRVDRYVPPAISAVKYPNLRRSLEEDHEGNLSLGADVHSSPPCSESADETDAYYSNAFVECEKIVTDFVNRVHGKIVNQTYSISKKWGNILRVKITFERDNSSTTTFLTCWSKSKSHVRFDLRFDCCGDCAKD
jgi:hypothetical protein